MHIPIKHLALIVCFGILTVKAQEINKTNPLLAFSNAPILFDQISAATIDEALSFVITDSEARIKKLPDLLPANIIFSTP
jgi:hypothetical protein